MGTIEQVRSHDEAGVISNVRNANGIAEMSGYLALYLRKNFCAAILEKFSCSHKAFVPRSLTKRVVRSNQGGVNQTDELRLYFLIILRATLCHSQICEQNHNV